MVAILVVFTVLVALTIDALVLSRRRARATAQSRPGLVPMKAPQPPQGIFVDDGHSWLRITSDGRLRVGVDDFLAEAIGEVERVDLPAAGTEIRRGAPLFSLWVRGRRLSVPSPAAGTVVSVNDRAVRDPGSLTQDPYGAGWIVSLFTRDHHSAIAPLRIGAAATHFLRQEMQRLADFLTPVETRTSIPVMADGGQPGHGSVAALPEEKWAEFQSSFVAVAAPEA